MTEPIQRASATSRVRSIGVRWTMGDVSVEGFEALRLSIWGAACRFGPDAAYQMALAGDRTGCVVAEDVRRCFGQFANMCGPHPRNSGIRGTPAGFDVEAALLGTLQRHPCQLASETDEQGLQIAALESKGVPLLVRASEVSIYSPFPPHSPDLGTCGAHFVGLNARSLPWEFYGRPASQVRRVRR